MSTRAATLAIEITADASSAVGGFDDLDTAADKATRSVKISADAADELGGKAGKATGALGALASGFELVGADKYAGALQSASMATDFFSGVGDSLNLVMESTIVKTTVLKAKQIALGIATKSMTAAQWAMNVAMSANPLGLIVAAIVGLGLALVVAYRKSETFRNIVNGALRAVGKVGTWLYEKAIAPAFRGIVKAIASVMDFFAKMLRVIGRVPGFGWAKTAADKMQNAADKARNLADGIGKVKSKKVTLEVKTGDSAHRVQSVAQAYLNVADAAERARRQTEVFGGTKVPQGPYAPSRTGGGARIATDQSTTGPQAVYQVTVNGALDPVAVGRQIDSILNRRARLIGRPA